MERHIVEFEQHGGIALHFACEADNAEHAVAQMDSAHPNAQLITVFEEVDHTRLMPATMARMRQ